MTDILSREATEKVFAIFSAANPAPKTELNYTNNYTLLVAVVLSAQATDKSVNIATRGLFKLVSTPEEMLQFGQEALAKEIKNIGLYLKKAGYIISLSRELIQKHQGKVPDDRKSLENLPGVGRKTASVVLNIAFKQNTIAVDTHIFRVARRLGLSNGKNPLEVERQLVAVVPERWLYNAHHWLILHGRYCCMARRPKCSECFVKNYCPAYHRQLRGEL